MFSWLNFFFSIFWIFFFSIFFNLSNFFTLLFNAEILWIVLYCLSALLSVTVDDISLFSLTFFLLGFAAIELSIGLMLLVLLKYSNVSLTFSDNYTALTSFTKNAYLSRASSFKKI